MIIVEMHGTIIYLYGKQSKFWQIDNEIFKARQLNN